jgi:hypothetical protein
MRTGIRSIKPIDWAPLALVAAYALIVIASPAVTAVHVGLLAWGHLLRNLVVAGSVAACILIGLGIADVASGGKRESPRRVARFVRHRWRDDRLFSLLMPLLYLALILASFSSFKQLVLPSAGFGFDPLFAELDRAVFLGADPWQVTHWLIPGVTGTRILDMLYAFWFFPMVLIVLLSGFAPRPLRTAYLVAFALTWILLGTIMAWLLPAGGPCYYLELHTLPDFAPLMGRLQAQSEALVANGQGPLFALHAQAMLMDSYSTSTFTSAGGISAMPSLHVALAVLFACAAFDVGRLAGWLMTGFAVLIWIGSVHLGWHYAVDGIAGGMMALLVWAGVRQMILGSAREVVSGKSAPSPV